MTTNTPPQATRRQWIGLAALALPTLLLSIDTSVLYLALPRLSADLHATSTQQLWIMDIYGFMIAGFLVTMGTLGDRIGRRKLLLIGATAFSIASVLAAFSSSAEILILARALMGIAGATLMPSTLALISNMFRHAKQRATAIGIWMSCFMVGMIIGPLIGGVMLEHFWWGSVFLLGVPVMLVLLVVGPIFLPEYSNPKAGKLDLGSVALSLAAILPIIYGLKESARVGLEPLSAMAIVAGITFAVVFARRQRWLKHPLLDLGLFESRNFSATLGILIVTAVLMGGMGLLIAQHLQLVEGFSPLLAGLWMIPQALGMLASSMIAPLLAQKFKRAHLVMIGLCITMLGFVLLSMVPGTDGLMLLVAGFMVATFGVGMVVVLATDLVVGSAPPEKAGSAASTSETSNELGIALGVATIGSLVTAVYRSNMAHIPSGVPGSAIGSIREGIVGAIAAAKHLPEPLQSTVVAMAHAAFTAGFHSAAIVSAGIFALLTASIIIRNYLHYKS